LWYFTRDKGNFQACNPIRKQTTSEETKETEELEEEEHGSSPRIMSPPQALPCSLKVVELREAREMKIANSTLISFVLDCCKFHLFVPIFIQMIQALKGLG
jgi:hypothetical protein